MWLIPILDPTTGDVKDGKVPQVSYHCDAEYLSLCKGMQPQLFLKYSTEGTASIPSLPSSPFLLIRTVDRIALLDVYNLLSYAAEVFQPHPRHKFTSTRPLGVQQLRKSVCQPYGEIYFG